MAQLAHACAQLQPGVASPAALPGIGSLVSAHGSMNHIAFDVPPPLILAWTPAPPFLVMVSRIMSIATLPDAPLTPLVPAPPFKLRDVSLTETLDEPPPVPSIFIAPPTLASMKEWSIDMLTVAPPVGLDNTPAWLLLMVVS